MSVFSLNLKVKKKTVNVGDLDIPLCWIRVGVETTRVLAWPLGRHMPTTEYQKGFGYFVN